MSKSDEKKPEEKNPGGRPKKEINYDTVEKLARIMCTQEEIAAVLDISVRTLQRDEEFCRIYKKGQELGKASLRRSQYNLAMSGNATMLVWLGKQLLDQSDKQTHEVDVTQPIVLKVDEDDAKA
jgi:hypothetical protein